ncbi:MAG: aminotransferase class I/II-fold pyridoxal phosphate-dependent enzyme [Ignavibacteriales bacterium]|nr:aminotransferase class I/II-fold pyridoxal phosphate-dependent enzyme [Ignavibacteriales bacterium]
MKKKKPALSTKAIHGTAMHPYRGPVSLPIYQTSTYRFKNSGDAIRYAQGDPTVYVYSRYHNPTVNDVEGKLAFVNDAESAILFASGMAAISTAIVTFVHSGDEIVSIPALYGGTYRFFRDVLPGNNIVVKYSEPASMADISHLITPKTKLVYFETPTNPTLSIVDIAGLMKQVKAAEKKFSIRILTMMDNTFATVLNQRPFESGVDLVVESATKYIGGHSDLLAGVVTGPRSLLDKIRTSAKYYGGCADPFMAYLLFRSLKTFVLRVQEQNRSARRLSAALEKHPKVIRVLYPGLKSHPHHSIAKKQMIGFGGMVTIEVRGGVRKAVRVCDALNVAVNAMSLGGVETLVSIPVYSSHVNMTPKELASHGVTPGMIRISVGLEDVDDLIADFDQALRA